MVRRAAGNRPWDAEHQIALGEQLAAEKLSCFATGTVWRKHVRKTFDLSRERADELIRISTGFTSVEQTRTNKRKSTQKSRFKKSQKFLDESAKFRFLYLVHRSKECCTQARSRISKKGFPEEDLSEMKKVATKMIADWQKLVKELV